MFIIELGCVCHSFVIVHIFRGAFGLLNSDCEVVIEKLEDIDGKIRRFGIEIRR